MQHFKKYDFVNFYVNDKLNRITYVSDVESSDGRYRICVDGGWYDAAYTKCIQTQQRDWLEFDTHESGRGNIYMITRCARDDIDKALENERIGIEKYQECIKLRREHGIIPTNYNDWL